METWRDSVFPYLYAKLVSRSSLILYWSTYFRFGSQRLQESMMIWCLRYLSLFFLVIFFYYIPRGLVCLLRLGQK